MENEDVKRDLPQGNGTSLTDQSMFNFTINCQSSNNETCNKVKSELEKAGQKISKTIKLNTPINVIVRLHNFCEIPKL